MKMNWTKIREKTASAIRRGTIVTGSVTLIVISANLFAPKATHAVVAALVQVVNNVSVVNPLDSSSNPIPLLTKRKDEPGRNPYSSTVHLWQGNSCSGVNCTAFFASVPANKRLVVTSVTGAVFVEAPGYIQPVWLDGVYIPSFLQIGTVQGPGNVTEGMFSFNSNVLLYYEAGTGPRAGITSSTNIAGNSGFTDGSVTMSGYLIDLP
jgi:hypothetical protein